MTGLIGRKIGMTSIFQGDGRQVAVTLLEVGPCHVTQVKTQEKEGYEAIQVSFGTAREKKVTKPARGHFEKAGVVPATKLVEFRNFKLDGKTPEVGSELNIAELFTVGGLVKVKSVSKGKGFQGTVKRHNFSRGPVTHGSKNVREPGSTGMAATPSRSIKGKKMPGRMGGKMTTIKGLRVVNINAENHILALSGTVPGPRNGIVKIEKQ